MKMLMYEGLDLSLVERQFAKLKEAIERDDFKSADIKKLGQGQYYRAKLDDSHRLLLTFLRHQNTRYCLALEVILHHRYEKSRFLRGAKIDETALQDLTDRDVSTGMPIAPYIHPHQVDFHVLDKVLSFDDQQRAVLGAPLPLVVVGSAGSGKTVLMLERIKKTHGRILYVTLSPHLAQHARSQYHNSPFETQGQQVVFCSYRELLESLKVWHGREVKLKDFGQWYSTQRQTHPFAQPEGLFEEFRGVITGGAAGVLTLPEYLQLGVRQSIYPVELREQVYALFLKYQRFLQEAQVEDINLLSHQRLPLVKETFDAVAVDEIQDFTQVQLAVVLKFLHQKQNFMLSGDANQIVHPNFFSWVKVRALLNDQEAFRLDVSVLRTNFRSSPQISHLANTILKIKHRRFGSVDRESNFLVQAADTQNGTVSVLRATPERLKPLVALTRQSAGFAVVVLHEDQKTEARQVYQTPLVFTVHEAKGLEYPHVVLHKVICSHRQAFLEVAEGVIPEDLQVTDLPFRRAKDKTDKSLEVYKFYVNGLYVAVTRGVTSVTLVEDDPEHPLILLLGLAELRQDTWKASKSTHSEWEQEAVRLERHGKQEQAQWIRQEVLKPMPVPWTVMKADWLDELLPKMNPRSPSSKHLRQILDYAVLHGLSMLVEHLGGCYSYKPALEMYPLELSAWLEKSSAMDVPESYQKVFQQARDQLLERHLAPYRQKSFKAILWDCEKYGVDHRNPLNYTPLMMAAMAGHVQLIDALLAKGAKIQQMDETHATAFLLSLRRAISDVKYAMEAFDQVYQRLRPDVVVVQVDGEVVRLTPDRGEYLVFLIMVAEGLFLQSVINGEDQLASRRKGFTAAYLTRNLEFFPECVWPAAWRNEAHVSRVLSRSERYSSDPAACRLWERRGESHYVLRRDMDLRHLDEHGDGFWLELKKMTDEEWQEDEGEG